MLYYYLRSSYLVLAIVLLAGFAAAEDPVFKEAAERCAEFESDVRDMHMVQTMKSFLPEGEMTFEQTVYTKGTKTRVEMRMPLSSFQGGEGGGAVETIMVSDGTDAWVISSVGGKKALTPEEALQNAPARLCWGYFPEHTVVTGSEIVDGRDCHMVDMVEDGVRTRLWLDKRNFMPVKGEMSDSTGAAGVRWVHSGFHAIQGEWEYPYRTEVYEGEALAATLDVISFEVNQGLSDDLFDPDKVEVQPLDLEDLMRMMAAPDDTLEADEDE